MAPTRKLIVRGAPFREATPGSRLGVDSGRARQYDQLLALAMMKSRKTCSFAWFFIASG